MSLHDMYGDIERPKSTSKVERKVSVNVVRSPKIQKLVIEGMEVWFPSIDYVHDLENELQQMKSAHQNLIERIRNIENRRSNERSRRFI